MKAQEAAKLAQTFKDRMSQEQKELLKAAIQGEYNRITSWIKGCAEHGYGAMLWKHTIRDENRIRLMDEDGFDIAYKGGLVLVWDATLPLCQDVGCWLPNNG